MGRGIHLQKSNQITGFTNAARPTCNFCFGWDAMTMTYQLNLIGV